MAGLPFSGKPAALIACVASTTDTLLQLVAPANQRVILDYVVVSFNGITAADPPILVDVLLQTSAGSGGTAVTLMKSEQSMAETIQSTCISGPTSEPTGTTAIYHAEHIHEQGGVVLAIPRRSIVIKGGERLGIRMTPGTLTASTSAMCTAHFIE